MRLTLKYFIVACFVSWNNNQCTEIVCISRLLLTYFKVHNS